jgi:adenine phosphoribosyltransferase
MRRIAELITDVPDFPEPGVVFRDITPLIGSPEGLAAAVDALVEISPPEVDVVLGIEARGFIFAAPVALALKAGLAPVRKPAKLPRETVSVTYDLEYGTETLALHADAVPAGSRVLIVDDVLATGGTALATAELVQRLGAELAGVSVLVELDYLGGRERLASAGIGGVRSVLTLSSTAS